MDNSTNKLYTFVLKKSSHGRLGHSLFSESGVPFAGIVENGSEMSRLVLRRHLGAFPIR